MANWRNVAASTNVPLMWIIIRLVSARHWSIDKTQQMLLHKQVSNFYFVRRLWQCSASVNCFQCIRLTPQLHAASSKLPICGMSIGSDIFPDEKGSPMPHRLSRRMLCHSQCFFLDFCFLAHQWPISRVLSGLSEKQWWECQRYLEPMEASLVEKALLDFVYS